ncbi:MAG TPA: hypothetical protein VF625_00220, partial [Longimicrobium sp.]
APVAPSAGGARPAAAQPDPVVDALVDVIRARYGTRINDEQMRAVREGVQGNLGLARTLRQFPIATAVEPALVFRVYRAGGRRSPRERCISRSPRSPPGSARAGWTRWSWPRPRWRGSNRSGRGWARW